MERETVAKTRRLKLRYWPPCRGAEAGDAKLQQMRLIRQEQEKMRLLILRPGRYTDIYAL